MRIHRCPRDRLAAVPRLLAADAAQVRTGQSFSPIALLFFTGLALSCGPGRRRLGRRADARARRRDDRDRASLGGPLLTGIHMLISALDARHPEYSGLKTAGGRLDHDDRATRAPRWVPLLAFLGFFLMSTGWALASPYEGTPDEIDPAKRAGRRGVRPDRAEAGAGQGRLRGPYQTVPAGLIRDDAALLDPQGQRPGRLRPRAGQRQDAGPRRRAGPAGTRRCTTPRSVRRCGSGPATRG